MAERLYTVSDVASLSGYGRKQIERAVSDGLLKVDSLGASNSPRFTLDTVRAFLGAKRIPLPDSLANAELAAPASPADPLTAAVARWKALDPAEAYATLGIIADALPIGSNGRGAVIALLKAASGKDGAS